MVRDPDPLAIWLVVKTNTQLDSVIWFGDFNYRVGLGLEAAKDAVKRRNLERLFENDQLNLQMVAGLSFRFYSEARITFMPTYKYDVGTDDFDSSEKARIPAWTDRILRKGSNLRQLAYNSAPLRFSDHRPVYAIFECTVNIVNEKRRDKISREVYERRKAEVGGDTANLAANESDDEDLIGYDAIEPGLPPASSDRQKWWLDNGKMAKSSISPPKPDNPGSQIILNPKRPTNPHAPTDEPDWVSVPRSESRLSSFSSMSTSPYEHVNHSTLLSSSASSSAPRKLPPPYDPSVLPTKMGRMQINDDIKSLHAEMPPPPPPRRQTSMGTGSGTGSPAPSAQQKRKPVNKTMPAPPVGPKPGAPEEQAAKQKAAPPVAKKPAHLAAPVSPASSILSASLTSDATLHGPEGSVASFPRRSTPGSANGSASDLSGGIASLPARNASLRERTPPPPQFPRRTNTSAGVMGQNRMAAAGGIPLVGLAGTQERKPQLPVRKPVSPAPVSSFQKQAPPPPPAPRKTPAVDLLADDGAIEMGGWEALKPSS
jgi:hypothetical protein